MLIEADFAQLELCVAAVLSQDPVLLEEIRSGVDLHSDNQKRLGLPDRLIAKIFVFRLLYGGNAYSYARDPDFQEISTRTAYWQKAIDAFYDKYKVLAEWHKRLIDEVKEHKGYSSPLGRTWKFELLPNGDLPVTDIKNYIVQGTGADLVSLCRVLIHRNLKTTATGQGLFRGTVHDSILFQVDSEEQRVLVIESIKNAWESLNGELKRKFGVEWNCPSRVEIKEGSSWGEMKVIYKG